MLTEQKKQEKQIFQSLARLEKYQFAITNDNRTQWSGCLDVLLASLNTCPAEIRTKKGICLAFYSQLRRSRTKVVLNCTQFT